MLFLLFFRDPVTPVFNERIITIEDPSFENPVEKCSNAEEEISRILRKSYQDDLNNMANINGRMPQVIFYQNLFDMRGKKSERVV